jgi:hypothetical protein
MIADETDSRLRIEGLSILPGQVTSGLSVTAAGGVTNTASTESSLAV